MPGTGTRPATQELAASLHLCYTIHAQCSCDDRSTKRPKPPTLDGVSPELHSPSRGCHGNLALGKQDCGTYTISVQFYAPRHLPSHLHRLRYAASHPEPCTHPQVFLVARAWGLCGPYPQEFPPLGPGWPSGPKLVAVLPRLPLCTERFQLAMP